MPLKGGINTYSIKTIATFQSQLPNLFPKKPPKEHAEKGQENSAFIEVEVADVHGEFPSDAKETSGLKVHREPIHGWPHNFGGHIWES